MRPAILNVYEILQQQRAEETRMPKKLNTWTLGGLIVGPILGSGIILLPPLAYERVGAQAVWAWLGILALGGAFSAVFIRMTLLTHSDSGIASLVTRERGPVWGALASNFLTGAVVFGVVPVLLTAARLWPTSWSLGWPPVVWAGLFLVVAVGLLLAGLTTVSRLTLVLSTTIALLLVAGSAVALGQAGQFLWPAPDLATPDLGPTLLLLFWAIVGWEVVANYSKEVNEPEKTVPRAGLLGLAVVSLVYLSVALAMQTQSQAVSAPSLTRLLVPLLSEAASPVTGVLTTALCLSTLLMFTGAVTRMTAQRAREGQLPRWLGWGNPARPPAVAIGVLAGTSTVILVLIGLGWVDLAFLVATANLFFLGNALLGLVAAWTMLPTFWWRVVLVGLIALFVALVFQGSVVGWVLVSAVVLGTVLSRKRG
jgi:APA family basic amino acid/polyamine antiporter